MIGPRDPGDDTPAPPARGVGRALARTIGNPSLVTLWTGVLGVAALFGTTALHGLHLPGFRQPLSPAIHVMMAWFPGDLILVAGMVFGAATAARWAVRGAIGSRVAAAVPARGSDVL